MLPYQSTSLISINTSDKGLFQIITYLLRQRADSRNLFQKCHTNSLSHLHQGHWRREQIPNPTTKNSEYNLKIPSRWPLQTIRCKNGKLSNHLLVFLYVQLGLLYFCKGIIKFSLFAQATALSDTLSRCSTRYSKIIHAIYRIQVRRIFEGYVSGAIFRQQID